jgi:hypothetical protein
LSDVEKTNNISALSSIAEELSHAAKANNISALSSIAENVRKVPVLEKNVYEGFALGISGYAGGVVLEKAIQYPLEEFFAVPKTTAQYVGIGTPLAIGSSILLMSYMGQDFNYRITLPILGYVGGRLFDGCMLGVKSLVNYFYHDQIRRETDLKFNTIELKRITELKGLFKEGYEAGYHHAYRLHYINTQRLIKQ